MWIATCLSVIGVILFLSFKCNHCHIQMSLILDSVLFHVLNCLSLDQYHTVLYRKWWCLFESVPSTRHTHTHILCFLLRRVLAILHLLIFCMNLRIIFSSSEKYLVRIFIVIILNWLDWSGGKIGVTTKLHFPINKYVSISIYLGILLCSSTKFYNFIDKNLAHHLLYLFLLLYILEFPLKNIFLITFFSFLLLVNISVTDFTYLFYLQQSW